MAVTRETAPHAPQGAAPENPDLGFGSVVARESRKRLLNREGSFNVRREGLGFWRSLSAYHFFLTVSWPGFLALTVAAYMLVNMLFAAAFLLCGPEALAGTSPDVLGGRFARAFFFSVDTLATIGYGNVAPVTLAANLLVTIEALVGLLGFALAAGLVFARVSRPTARIIFSDRALVAPYRDITAFMFRIANSRSNQIVELEAKVLLSWRRGAAGDREFLELALERRKVAFFPLSLTVVHPIDEASPLAGVTAKALESREAEFLILLTGMDETFSQSVHARSSYKADEVVFGARFKGLFNPPAADGTLSVDIGRLHDWEPV